MDTKGPATFNEVLPNRWPNRMIGDKQPADANVRTTGRYTFSTHDPYKQQSPLVSAGLLGPVTLRKEHESN